MIDTIRLTFEGSSFELHEPEFFDTIIIKKDKEEILHDYGEGLICTRAWMNTDLFQAELNKRYKFDTAEIVTILSIQTNLTKLSQKHNYKDITKEEVFKNIENLKDSLWENGLCCDFKEAYIERLDIGSVSSMTYNIDEYLKVLSEIKGTAREKQSSYSYETLSWRTKSTETLLYDKRKELEEKEQMNIDENLLRTESRYKRKQMLFRLKVSTIRSLKENYESFLQSWKDSLVSRFEKYEKALNERFLNKDAVEAVFLAHYANKERYWLNNALKTLGLHTVLQNTSIESLLISLNRAGVTAYSISKLRQSLNEVNFVDKTSYNYNLFDEFYEAIKNIELK